MRGFQRKHLLVKQRLWQACEPEYYANTWATSHLVTTESNNVNDQTVFESRAYDAHLFEKMMLAIVWQFASAHLLHDVGPNWFENEEVMNDLINPGRYGEDLWEKYGLTFLKDGNPASILRKWIATNKTVIDGSIPVQRPVARPIDWDLYMNFTDESNDYYLQQDCFRYKTPDPAYTEAFEYIFGIPKELFADRVNNLYKSALFMKPESMKPLAWILMDDESKLSLIKGTLGEKDGTKEKVNGEDSSFEEAQTEVLMNRSGTKGATFMAIPGICTRPMGYDTNFQVFMGRIPPINTPGMLPTKGPIFTPQTRFAKVPPYVHARADSQNDPSGGNTDPNDEADEPEDENNEQDENEDIAPLNGSQASGARGNNHGPPDGDDDGDDNNDDDGPGNNHNNPRRGGGGPGGPFDPARGPGDQEPGYDDPVPEYYRGKGPAGKTLGFKDIQALQNYNGKRTGPRVSNFLADFESALRLLSGRTLPTPGNEWGLLLKSKLEGDARIAIDALQASLNRVPTYVEMHDALRKQFAFSYEDAQALTAKLEKLTWDGSWTLGDYLNRFWSLSLRISDKRSNMDLVRTLKNALPRFIINQIEGQFSVHDDPPLEDIIQYLRRTSWINQTRDPRGIKHDGGRRGNDSRGRARGRFAGSKRPYGSDEHHTPYGRGRGLINRTHPVGATVAMAKGVDVQASIHLMCPEMTTLAIMAVADAVSFPVGAVMLVVVVGRYHPLLAQMCKLIWPQ